MAFETHAKLILEAIAKTTDIKKVRNQLKGVGKEAQKQGVAFAGVSKAMQRQGVAGKELSAKLRHLSKNMGNYGIHLQRNGIFIDNLTRKKMHYDAVAKKVLQTTKQTARTVAKTGPEQVANVNNVTQALKAQGMQAFKIKQGINSLTNNWRATGVQLNKNNQFIDANTQGTMQLGDVQKKVGKHGSKPFRGELLSLMFVAMQLSATFGGMIRSVLQMTGIFDMFRGILASILLPILMPLIAKWLPKFLDWLKDKEHRKFLGHLIIFAAALGTILTLGAQLGLLVTGFGGMGSLFGMLAKGATTFGGKIGMVLSRLFGAFIVVWGVFRIFSGWLEGDWWKIVSGVLLAVAGIVAFVMGGWIPALIAGLVAVLVWLGDRFKWVRNVIMASVYAVIAPFLVLYDIVKSVGELIKGIFTGDFSGVGFKATTGMFKNFFGLAEGGIVTKPTLAMVGEAGPEAVVPLSKGGEAGMNMGAINYNPTINVNTTGSDVDVDRLVNIINEKLYDDLRRTGIR